MGMGHSSLLTSPALVPRSRERALGFQAGLSLALFLSFFLSACEKGPSLSRLTEEEEAPPDLGSVEDENLRLGALADQTPIYSRPRKTARPLGFLHAGATVARSEKSFENNDCTEGWYAIAPRGYVCTEKAATLELQHPTLLAMALQPALENPLPYVYARTTQVTSSFKRNQDSSAVEMEGRLGKGTVLAIVGSWTAPDESKEPQFLGLRMNGLFVRAEDLQEALGSSFVGQELNEEQKLPLAYVVRRGVRYWSLDGSSATKKSEIAYHTQIPLTGRYRTVEEERFWATSSDLWVRHRDVTVVQQRHEFPEFAQEGRKWIDVSVITGTFVAYEGQTPVYASLLSVGRDRLGDPKTTAATELGTHTVLSKQITRRSLPSPDEPLHDAPWAFELSSGQWLYASPRHNRFGIEHTEGDLEVSPADGHWLFHWLGEELPAGWHGMNITEAEPPLVHVRK